MSESEGDSGRLRCDEHPLSYIDEIMINILPRLPAKTVGACKSVAKRFLKLISERGFPIMHLNMSTRKSRFTICPFPMEFDKVCRLFVMEDWNISEDISLPGIEFNDEVHCFPNGLACSVHEDVTGMMDVDIRIFNPLTKDAVLLPRGSPSAVMPTVGAAFDPITNEYKAYRFFSDSERVNAKYKCEVYTAGSKAWRKIGEEVEHPNHSIYHPRCPFYASVAGVMYWFVWADEDPGEPASILCVDMEDNFAKIDLPAELNNWSYLIEFEGCLAVVHMNNPQLSENNRHEDTQPFVEVFKFENGEWNLRLRHMMMVDMSDVYCFNSVAALGNEIFFIVQFEDDESFDYIVFDFVEETFKTLDMDEHLEGYFPVAYPFAESLLSPSQM
ncbi:hypothetical protein ACS0TY_017781 [Phlomoides rotata]